MERFLNKVLFFFYRKSRSTRRNGTCVTCVHVLIRDNRSTMARRRFLVVFTSLVNNCRSIIPTSRNGYLKRHSRFLLRHKTFKYMRSRVSIVINDVLHKTFQERRKTCVCIPTIINGYHNNGFSYLFVIVVFGLQRRGPQATTVRFFRRTTRFRYFFDSSFIFDIYRVSSLLFPPVE